MENTCKLNHHHGKCYIMAEVHELGPFYGRHIRMSLKGETNIDLKMETKKKHTHTLNQAINAHELKRTTLKHETNSVILFARKIIVFF